MISYIKYVCSLSTVILGILSRQAEGEWMDILSNNDENSLSFFIHSVTIPAFLSIQTVCVVL